MAPGSGIDPGRVLLIFAVHEVRREHPRRRYATIGAMDPRKSLSTRSLARRIGILQMENMPSIIATISSTIPNPQYQRNE
jgi:hypothetical protein